MKTLKQKIKRLFEGGFARNVSVLVGGTAFSQLIGILALPILTRLYTPQDFTVLATYISILGLLLSISCLRFEIAIPLPKEQKDAIHLFALSIISLFCIVLLTIIAVTLGANVVNVLTNQLLEEYLWLLPLGVLFGGMYSTLSYWMIREKKFPLVARTRMTQAISGATTQIGSGYLGITPVGLLLGQVLNSGAGIFSFVKVFVKEYKPLLSKISLSKLTSLFKQYERFPKYSTWEALMNSAGIQIPILIIATLAIGAEAGFLMLAMRILSAPLGLIGNAVSQVYLSEAADKYDNGYLKDFTVKTILVLAKLGILPLFLAGILAPYVIPVVFGNAWQRTGVLISWMIPWFFMQFITSPVSMSLHVTGSQKLALLLQFSGLCIRGGSVYIAALYYNNFIGEVYALSGFVFYTIYLLIVLKVIDGHSKNKKEVKC
jgi:O-antigen/teichoic acid export membrane protein